MNSEWAAHAVFGLEFRSRYFIVTRLEAGHRWLFESEADMWTTTLTLSFQF